MKKKLNELSEEEYSSLYKSGMFWEFYPEATGDFKKDVGACHSYFPEVGGRKLNISNQEFENRCKFYIGLELNKINPDNALISVLSDGVRLAREYSDVMNSGQ